MFAVIKTGGKQYKVAEGDEIVIEKLTADAGESVTVDDVLMLGDGKKVTIGEPVVSGASVVGTVAEQRKGAKVIIMKKRQRNTYRLNDSLSSLFLGVLSTARRYVTLGVGGLAMCIGALAYLI